MTKTSMPLALLAVALVAPASAVVHTDAPTFEERQAKQEEQRIFRAPIAGIRNSSWFNYRTNLVEARKELANDLNGAGDMEDLRDAWDEYRGELVDSRHDYAKKMAKKGYRIPNVSVID